MFNKNDERIYGVDDIETIVGTIRFMVDVNTPVYMVVEKQTKCFVWCRLVTFVYCDDKVKKVDLTETVGCLPNFDMSWSVSVPVQPTLKIPSTEEGKIYQRLDALESIRDMFLFVGLNLYGSLGIKLDIL